MYFGEHEAADEDAAEGCESRALAARQRHCDGERLIDGRGTGEKRREENDVEKHCRVEPHRHDEIALNRHTVVLVARRAGAKFDEQPLAL